MQPDYFLLVRFLTGALAIRKMHEPLMLILRGEQGVRMGFNPACVDRQTSTFSSDLDGRVFLCPLKDVKRADAMVRVRR